MLEETTPAVETNAGQRGVAFRRVLGFRFSLGPSDRGTAFWQRLLVVYSDGLLVQRGFQRCIQRRGDVQEAA
jgi:hypothetical protein